MGGNKVMNITNTVISVLLLLILVGVYNLPNHVYKLIEEKYKSKNSQQLQVESYFRQISGSKQEEILSKWTSFLTDMENATKKYSIENKESTKLFRELIHDTIMYGSDRTIRYVDGFKLIPKFDLNTKASESIDQLTKQVKEQKPVVYMACIICSLKQDFTGYKNSPIDLLKITIRDYERYAGVYEVAWKEIQEEVKNDA